MLPTQIHGPLGPIKYTIKPEDKPVAYILIATSEEAFEEGPFPGPEDMVFKLVFKNVEDSPEALSDEKADAFWDFFDTADRKANLLFVLGDEYSPEYGAVIGALRDGGLGWLDTPGGPPPRLSPARITLNMALARQPKRSPPQLENKPLTRAQIYTIKRKLQRKNSCGYKIVYMMVWDRDFWPVERYEELGTCVELYACGKWNQIGILNVLDHYEKGGKPRIVDIKMMGRKLDLFPMREREAPTPGFLAKLLYH